MLCPKADEKLPGVWSNKEAVSRTESLEVAGSVCACVLSIPIMNLIPPRVLTWFFMWKSHIQTKGVSELVK